MVAKTTKPARSVTKKHPQLRIVLLGAPGSGKGTQAKLLMQHYNIPQISTGDLLRAAVTAGSSLGLQAKAAMDAGQLVSDDIVLGMIEERLAAPDMGDSFILDGFPRNIQQAESLDVMLHKVGQPLQAAILIDVDFDILMQRLTGRRTCESCGQMYNIYSSPPRLDDQCDKCGGNLRHRADDNEETIGSRLRIYDAQTSPLNGYYQAQHKFRSVQGIGEISDIYTAMQNITEELISKPAAAVNPAEATGLPEPVEPGVAGQAAAEPVSEVESQASDNGAAPVAKSKIRKKPAGPVAATLPARKSASMQAVPEAAAGKAASSAKAASGKISPVPAKPADVRSKTSETAVTADKLKGAPQKAASAKPAVVKAVPKQAAPVQTVRAATKAATGKKAEKDEITTANGRKPVKPAVRKTTPAIAIAGKPTAKSTVATGSSLKKSGKAVATKPASTGRKTGVKTKQA